MSAGVTELTDSTFDAQVVDVPGPVLVEFSTDWDGASMMMTSTLDEIAVEYASTLSVAKHNIDRYPVTPPRYDVRAVQTAIPYVLPSV